VEFEIGALKNIFDSLGMIKFGLVGDIDEHELKICNLTELEQELS
jgi:phosphatidate phosphatase APP1